MDCSCGYLPLCKCVLAGRLLVAAYSVSRSPMDCSCEYLPLCKCVLTGRLLVAASCVSRSLMDCSCVLTNGLLAAVYSVRMEMCAHWLACPYFCSHVFSRCVQRGEGELAAGADPAPAGGGGACGASTSTQAAQVRL